MSWSYSSDGIVPMVSAQFVGPSVWQRAEAFACDHRYLHRGYQEFVRSAAATYTDWAFCAGANGNTSYPSGTSGGYAVSGSIHGITGGIIETIRMASDSERVFDWAEQAYAAYLQPAGSTSEIHDGYYYRYYPSTQAHVGVKGGNVYYMGPASGGQVQSMGTLADFLAQAQGSGF